MLEKLKEELVAMENRFHDLVEPERMIADKVREMIKSATDELSALKARVDQLEQLVEGKVDHLFETVTQSVKTVEDSVTEKMAGFRKELDDAVATRTATAANPENGKE